MKYLKEGESDRYMYSQILRFSVVESDENNDNQMTILCGVEGNRNLYIAGDHYSRALLEDFELPFSFIVDATIDRLKSICEPDKHNFTQVIDSKDLSDNKQEDRESLNDE